MSTASFEDRYTREDGEIGDEYTIPCGNAALFDEAVIPINASGAASGLSGWEGTTEEKTQVLYTGDTMDGPEYQVSAVWFHSADYPFFQDGSTLISRAQKDPSFTVLARMSRDPMLVDLGTDEQAACYDQGYGVRITCPRDASAPTLKIIKFSPIGIPPGVSGPQTATEVDKAQVLASVVLDENNLNVDDDNQVSGGTPLYRGYVQRVKLRIRRHDDEVILEAYLNDRNIDQPLLTFTDQRHPLWGDVGVPGFEFISATINADEQPAGLSPDNLQAEPVMACQLFRVDTIKDTMPARVSTPINQWTYDRVATRVIVLVEKNGDARYNATVNGQTKQDTYLDFVLEAEAELIRDEGYYDWLRRNKTLIFVDGQSDYELPEDVGEIEFIAPSTWSGRVLAEVRRIDLERQTRASVLQSSGRPQIYTKLEQGPNNRPRYRFYPTPNSDELEVNIDYFARQIRPAAPTEQIPFVPQQDMDCLIYCAAAKAMMLDTDPENIQVFLRERDRKILGLKRRNNRKLDGRQTTMRSVADVFSGEQALRIPLTRSTQLDHLLFV